MNGPTLGAELGGGGKRTGVFLDRDGTLMEDVGYPRDPEQVRLLPGVPDALRQLQQAGARLIIVSNQSGIGRGLITPDQAKAVHERLIQQLEGHDVIIDASRYCPHAPGERCACRKPSPVMLQLAASGLGIELGASYMIGDKESDVEAGRRAGCRTVLLSLGSDTGVTTSADHVARDLSEACGLLLAGARA